MRLKAGSGKRWPRAWKASLEKWMIFATMLKQKPKEEKVILTRGRGTGWVDLISLIIGQMNTSNAADMSQKQGQVKRGESVQWMRSS
jgi:hypothetical protein